MSSLLSVTFLSGFHVTLLPIQGRDERLGFGAMGAKEKGRVA